ncbi:DUF4913 domain-containing protein [Nocardia sp. CA-107356]|uniref:DUF4913 domain-containing protein n=1 Tax=Nocardia sp. CA-107356 TaxID=3239972 RepID=UPI003D8E5DA5
MTGKQKRTPPPPKYRDFVTFAQAWLLPVVNVRLAEGNREGTYTWCPLWWSHRAVSVRIAHLHPAFETSRARSDGGAVSSYLLHHVDAHFRVIMDAANGPLHRCTRTKHVAVPSLTAEPVPPGWFGLATPTPPPPRSPSGEDSAQPPPLRFTSFVDFVEQWLLPVTCFRLAGKNREGNLTWCRQWWRHRAVAVRFAALHAVFEAARRSDDGTAMSSLFINHIDPQMRMILDAANGPLYRCSPEHHNDIAALSFRAVPEGWFGMPGDEIPVEEAGFGPDFRMLSAAFSTP